MAMPLALRRFTVDEYHRMGQAGIFHEDDRVELLDGQIVEMSPIGPDHASCVTRGRHPGLTYPSLVTTYASRA